MVCIIPYVDTSMFVIVSLTLQQDHSANHLLLELADNPRPLLVRPMRQHTSKFILLGIEMAIHHEGQNCIVHWPRTSGVVYL